MRKPDVHIITAIMFKTYIRLAFRSLVKNKVFSFINVFGLAIGLTCCLLISMHLVETIPQFVLGVVAEFFHQVHGN